MLEHEALHAAPARTLAQRGTGRPVGHRHLGRQGPRRPVRQGRPGGETRLTCLTRLTRRTREIRHPRQTGRRPQGAKALAPQLLRQGAQVHAVLLQQVIGHEAHRRLRQDPFCQLLAGDALLQQGEGGGLVLPRQPGQHLAVQHRAFRQPTQRGLNLGKALGHQFLAARPDPHLAGTAHHLGADAVVLPLHQPVGHRAQGGVRRCLRQRVRQEEGVGVAGVQRGRPVLRHQGLEALCAGRVPRVGVAHHALGHGLGVDTAALGQRALHQQLADPDAKAAADQFHQQESALGVQLVEGGAQARCLLLRAQPLQRQQALLHPMGQARVAAAGRGRQHMGDGFGQVAHGLVALVEQPVVDAGHGAGRLAQQRRGHHLARLAAGQEVHGPGRVLGRRLGEVVHHGRHLGRGGRAGVQLLEQVGKAAHGRMMPGRCAERARCATRGLRRGLRGPGRPLGPARFPASPGSPG